MNASLENVSNVVQHSHLAPLLLDALLKSFVVLALAGAVCLIWRRASAATKYLIWFLAVASLPFLPLLSSVMPSWQKPIWSVSSEMVSGNQVSLTIELAPRAAPANPVGRTEATGGATASADSSLARRSSLYAAHFSNGWLTTGFFIWSGGFVLLGLYLMVGQFQLGRISRRARSLQIAAWTPLLKEALQTLRIRRAVTLLQSQDNVMPMTWGWLRPVVLLPAEADQWPEERRRIVLLHELAHVKRRDCLTQFIARLVCALYWFNPLVWLAARRMCVERERACDDLVLNGGCQASDYASHLVEIAKSFRRMPQVGAIAMARASGLEKRVVAIMDASRFRRLRPVTVWTVLLLISGLIFCIGGWSAETPTATPPGEQQVRQLEAFSKAKLKQSETLTAASGEKISPEYQRLFNAAIKGDWKTVTNMNESFKKRHPQYERRPGIPMDIRLCTSPWEEALEICLAYDHIANCDPKYTQIAVDGVIGSIPSGSIYFGGTDPGRGLPTAFSKSHVGADPFYTLTQNALANGDYLAYLRDTYGERRHWLGLLSDARRADGDLQAWDREYQNALETEASLMSQYPEHDPKCDAADKARDDLKKKRDKRADAILAEIQARTDSQKKAGLLGEPPKSIYIPTEDDSQNAFAEYTTDAQRRLEHDETFPNEPRQIKPGENVKKDKDGKIQVTGQIAVMSINALLAKIIFDKNPDREFYIEESFPLDWMYPYLEPHGMIMKINREPLAELSDEVMQKDHDCWQKRVSEMIGGWLTEETPVKTVTEFAEKVYLRKDLSGFTGDARFVRDNYAPKMFSKWRGSIAGVYSWRIGIAPSGGTTPKQYIAGGKAEREWMIKEADFALKQAFAICPFSPEAVYRYVNFLVNQKRVADAILIAEAASRIDPANNQLKDLVRNLKALK